MIDLDSIVSVNADLLSTEIDGELVMMDMDSGRYVNLDAIGTAVWRELSEPRAVAAVCAVLADRYEAEPGEIERDVLELMRRLDEMRLIRVHG
ncbi:PqqD family protein [Oharaeibacter diazotrophicus]|uniref:Coenzyme PQQ synthesis protein D (PqqD) n=1 Tax=Oharaeibacter diazotrophicus TaxID=1920512 RepID=A0A4R6RF92_9HYPH|nr:PqqD family protein [Oharaeibacter diazotrophicus]TDP84969.1 coenzyme PQQ synthesis protein D (PqqD) [Oharaeibacter diazotrophicus]BBE73938.1 coenzyme PQQ synthesis protein D [Pleomorphomonas sp. SM30]GLS76376.1 hypothetical protein GCM10007904_17110 [Oharaeibacter diazotrophicus]